MRLYCFKYAHICKSHKVYIFWYNFVKTLQDGTGLRADRGWIFFKSLYLSNTKDIRKMHFWQTVINTKCNNKSTIPSEQVWRVYRRITTQQLVNVDASEAEENDDKHLFRPSHHIFKVSYYTKSSLLHSLCNGILNDVRFNVVSFEMYGCMYTLKWLKFIKFWWWQYNKLKKIYIYQDFCSFMFTFWKY
jgi:hypothetical protein